MINNFKTHNIGKPEGILHDPAISAPIVAGSTLVLFLSILTIYRKKC